MSLSRLFGRLCLCVCKDQEEMGTVCTMFIQFLSGTITSTPTVHSSKLLNPRPSGLSSAPFTTTTTSTRQTKPSVLLLQYNNVVDDDDDNNATVRKVCKIQTKCSHNYDLQKTLFPQHNPRELIVLLILTELGLLLVTNSSHSCSEPLIKYLLTRYSKTIWTNKQKYSGQLISTRTRVVLQSQK